MKIFLFALLFVVFIITASVSIYILTLTTDRLLSPWQCTVIDELTKCTKTNLLNTNLTYTINSIFSFLPNLLFAPVRVFSSWGEKIYGVDIITFRPTDWDTRSLPAINFGLISTGLYYFIFGVILGYCLNKPVLRKKLKLVAVCLLIVQLFIYSL